MARRRKSRDLRILREEKLFGDVIYQEILTSKGAFVERYQPPVKNIDLEFLLFVGLNILPSTKYFGYFPFNLCKEINAGVSVVYELGCSGKLCPHFRRFTQTEAEEQYISGFEVLRGFEGRVIIFSHSASTIEHFKLIFDDKYKHLCGDINISGGIISAAVTNILVELRKVWPNYKILNWKNIMKIARFFDIPLPVYPYYSKYWHAKYSPMKNLSIWINSRTAEFLLSTNIKKIILNGKAPNYPLLVFISKDDLLFSPRRQKSLVKYMAKKAKINVVQCNAEHNLFLSNGTFNILHPIKEYLEKII